MSPSQVTQDTLIQALVLLRKAHPQLPTVAWEITSHPSVAGLRGSVFGQNDVDVLLAYAEALGGEILPRHTFECTRGRMQTLYLETEFADVKVELRGAVPAPNLSHLSLVAA
jgi:hypothetical protein